MPNYLQRVATAGARTSSSIRPPAAAPPLVPGGIPTAVAPLQPAGEAGVEAIHMMQEQAVPPQQSRMGADPISPKADFAAPEPASSTEKSPERSNLILPGPPMTTRNVVQAPRGLRRESQPLVGVGQAETRLPVGQEPPTSAAPPQRAKPVESQGVRPTARDVLAPEQVKAETAPVALRERSFGSVHSPQDDKVASQMENGGSSPAVSEVAVVPSARSIPEATPTATPLHATSPQQPNATAPDTPVPRSQIAMSSREMQGTKIPPSKIPSAANVEPRSPEEVSDVIGVEHSGAERRVEPRVVQSASFQSRSSQSTSSQSTPRTNISIPNIRSTSEREQIVDSTAIPAAAKVIPLPAPAGSPQNKIHIGQIEVQVNNQAPPVSRVEPTPTGNAARADFLEARYLNRFAMRP